VVSERCTATTTHEFHPLTLRCQQDEGHDGVHQHVIRWTQPEKDEDA
jgi:hypothetical protein